MQIPIAQMRQIEFLTLWINLLHAGCDLLQKLWHRFEWNGDIRVYCAGKADGDFGGGLSARPHAPSLGFILRNDGVLRLVAGHHIHESRF